MKLVHLIVVLVIMSYSVKAQDQHVIDSLKSVIEFAEHDTSICEAYLTWGEKVHLNDPDSALVLWQKAHDLAEQNLHAWSLDTFMVSSIDKSFLGLFGSALHNIGYSYRYKGDAGMALEYYFKGLRIQEKIGDKFGIAYSLTNIGNVYDALGNVQKSLEYQFGGLEIQEEIGDREGVSNSLNNIGNVYASLGEFSQALEYYLKCVTLCEGDRYLIGSLGDTYWNAAEAYLAMNDSVHHREYLRKAAETYLNLNTVFGDASAYYTIGDIWKAIGEMDSAIFYYQKALPLYKLIDRPTYVCWAYREIGSCCFAKGEFDKAIGYGYSSLDCARKLGSVDEMGTAAALLSAIYRRLGKFKGALEMYELHIQMRDSINNEKTQKATIRQQTKYEFEKAQLVKEQEEKESARLVAEETSRRDNLQYSVILIAILTLFGGVLALGFINVSERMAEGIIFFSFLILFEFLLVLADPYIEGWSGGAPGVKLLFNAGIAALIFPAHAFFEARLKKRLVKQG